MPRTFLAATALALLSLTACGADFESGAPDELKSSLKTSSTNHKKTTTAQATWATLTTDAHTAGVEPSWMTSFVIVDTFSVEIASEVPSTTTGHHSLNVYVYSPSGALYQSFSIPFAAGTAAGAGEQQAESTASGFRVWASLPVKGTFIDSYNMTGSWRAESWVDGAGPNSSAGFQLQ